jgi:hypothetical protein
MIFWLGILAAAFCAWLAVRIGFYEMWAMLFNVLISVYLAVVLTPVIAEVVPAAAEPPIGAALTLIALAAGSFLILHVISYTFLTGQFRVTFPKILDNLGSGILGFLGGFLIWSFLTLVVSVTPLSQNAAARNIGFGPQITQTTAPYLSWWCDLVNTAAASPDVRQPAQETIARLLDDTAKKAAEGTDPNAPAAPADNNSKTRFRLRRPPLEDF